MVTTFSGEHEEFEMRSRSRAHARHNRRSAKSIRPATVSVLAIAGIFVAGSSAIGTPGTTGALPSTVEPAPPPAQQIVGLLPVTPPAAFVPHAAAEPLPSARLASTVGEISGPATSSTSGNAAGIPEIALAAYRNAELLLAQSQPNCGLSWSLLAGIGRIESGHASGGNTDASGTTLSPILGPALDGSLPGNEIIRSASGYVRAIGPMQFLPSTWSAYASDGNGDGTADPNNVIDAALAAGKYLCSGGLDLRDPAQEWRAVLRYNNSTAYASNVLGWAAAYRNGGSGPTWSGDITPSQSPAPSGVPPTNTPVSPEPTIEPAPTETPQAPSVTPPTEPMINIPGLPPIPCGIFCPAPPPTSAP